jgi:hypothetical protein
MCMNRAWVQRLDSLRLRSGQAARRTDARGAPEEELFPHLSYPPCPLISPTPYSPPMES